MKPPVIGVISDTHGLLRPEAMEALRGVEHIVHAGDVGDPAILDSLRALAPVTAVGGNIDVHRPCSNLPAIEVVLRDISERKQAERELAGEGAVPPFVPTTGVSPDPRCWNITLALSLAASVRCSSGASFFANSSASANAACASASPCRAMTNEDIANRSGAPSRGRARSACLLRCARRIRACSGWSSGPSTTPE